MATVSHVMINLYDLAIPGKRSVLVRLDGDDMKRIQHAARLIGVTQAQFLRTTAVRAADAIINEVGS